MIKRFLFILIFFSATISSFATEEDIVSLSKKDNERQTSEQSFMDRMFWNPALQLFRYDNSLSTVSVKGIGDDFFNFKGMEEGDGQLGIKVDAESYVKLNPNARIWGNAYYSRSKRMNVLWNESSDFQRLYPYVSADTLGGSLSQETYYFKGGYVHKLNRWTIGAEFHYRALLEFRKVDPRPRNSVAELQGKIGTSFALTPIYSLSLSVSGEKYKQNDELKYYNELGVSKTYHLQGLGASYVRFDGTNNYVYYDGRTWKTGIDLLPTSSKGGFLLSAYYINTKYDKILPSINNLALNGIEDQGFEGQIGWNGHTASDNWGVKGTASYRKRDGMMMLYGDAANNEYPLIVTKKNFLLKDLSAYLSGYWEMKPLSKWFCGAEINAGYVSRYERNADTKSKMTYSGMDLNLKFHTGWQWKNDGLHLNVSGGYLPNIDSYLKIKRVTVPYAEKILRTDFAYFKSDKAHYRIGLKYAHTFKTVMLSLETDGGQFFSTCGRDGYIWTASIGVSF